LRGLNSGSGTVFGSFEGSFRDLSEDARTRGFQPPPFGGFGFVGVASDLIIVAVWQVGSRSPMPGSGRERPPPGLYHLNFRFRGEAAL